MVKESRLACERVTPRFARSWIGGGIDNPASIVMGRLQHMLLCLFLTIAAGWTWAESGLLGLDMPSQ